MTKGTLYFGNVLYLSYGTQKDMMLAWARVSEFSESAVPGVQGKYLSWEEWLEAYMQPDGSVPFTTEWEGFNISGKTLKRWERLNPWGMMKQLTGQERELLATTAIHTPKPEYIIAGLDGATETFEHEMAHALWYTNINYRVAVGETLTKLSDSSPLLRQRVFAALRIAGYDSAIPLLIDEWQAYMVAGGDEVFTEALYWDLGLDDMEPNPIRAIFLSFMEGQDYED